MNNEATLNIHMHSFSQFLLEYDRAKTIASLGSKFRARFENDPDAKTLKLKDENTVLGYLEKGDPTPNHQYVQWLVKAYTNGSRLEDLISRGHSALEKFHKAKIKKLLNPEQADIGKLPTLRDLENLTDTIQIPEEESIDKGQSEEVYRDDQCRIIVPKDEKAACYYGQGTRWCTAAKRGNRFNHYTQSGQLYILIPTNPSYVGEKYQLHFEENQLMDEKDEPVKKPFLKKKFPKAYQFIMDEFLKTDSTNLYALKVVKGRWPEGEDVIAKDLLATCQYVYYVLKGPFPKGEDVIAKDSSAALQYAHYILKGPFPKGEDAIAKDPQDAYQYAYHVLKGPFPKGEDAIAEIPDTAYQYARHILKKRWLPAEKAILNSSDVLVIGLYAREVIKGRWPEGEEAMLKHIAKKGFLRTFDNLYLNNYAKNVIKGPWPEAEKLQGKNNV